MTADEGRRGGDRHAMVPEADVRRYVDQPILHDPVWTAEIPWYFFTGGLAGASSTLALALRASGEARLSVTLERVALCATLASPPLLISDLGRPARFFNMLRVFKVTSPMSVGSWILAVYAPAAGAAGVLGILHRLPRCQSAARVVAGVLGPPLATYTAVLVGNTAVPVWHEAGTMLPFVFAGSALASAAASAAMLTAPTRGGPARIALVAGAAIELAAVEVMERRLGTIADPYHHGVTQHYTRAAKAFTAAGALLVATLGRRFRSAALAGGATVLAGSVCERFAVYKAGFGSVADPRALVALQRRRRHEHSEGPTGAST